MTPLSQKIIRYTLAALPLLIATNTFGRGYFAILPFIKLLLPGVVLICRYRWTISFFSNCCV